jgi:hypothetical protein
MATNPIGKGTKTIGINMELERITELETRAKSMELPTGKYCKIILQRFLDSGEKLSLTED